MKPERCNGMGEKENILILAVFDLPDLGGSKLIADQGYGIETLVSYH